MLEEKIEPCLPDYKDSILNLSCSILKHFGVEPDHSTLPGADYILSKNFPHVVVILLDGLGMNILEQNLSVRDFLRRNLYSDYSSVFPPTTTASTTSFLSGLSPIEHGWLGWDLYFDKEKKSVCCFRNTVQSTETPAAEYNVAHTYLPYKNIVDRINEKGTAKANIIFPFGENAHSELNDWINEIRKSVNTKERTFTYAYWEDPDATLHRIGNGTKQVEKVVRDLNTALTDLCETTKDTLFIITADHGHTQISNCFLTENYPQIVNMLERQVCIEPRAISFYVKDEYKEEFPEVFNTAFGKDYVLYTKEQVMKEELFGPGMPNENLTGIGDFVAAAVSNKTILWSKKENQFKSHHAGLTKDEMRIPLIWYGKKSVKNLFLYFYYGVITAIVMFLLYIIFV